MHLYHQTLATATGCTQAVHGSFTAPKAQELVLNHGTSLELLRPDDSGRLQQIHFTSAFSTIRSLDCFRIVGGQCDYLAVGSDSGRIVILLFSRKLSCFQKVHEETFGKSGSRRNVPGQYITCDPSGRAVLVGAIEKQKLVYILNRDGDANLTISSPLEAHKSSTLCWNAVALDCGYDNPYFAAIELDYTDADELPEDGSDPPPGSSLQQMLTFYFVDLGLNHVVRQTTTPLETRANRLVTVPGSSQGGPGGVLVCSEDYISYMNENHSEVRAALPRRDNLPAERSVLITCTSTYIRKKHQQVTLFFLVQSEYGDLYKVTLDHSQGHVSDVVVSYFDTIPPAVSICLMKSGILFAASSTGNHQLFQVSDLGENEPVKVRATDSTTESMHFSPRKLSNLVLIDSMDSLSPIVDLQPCFMSGEQTPRLYAACGASTRSSFKIVRQGMALSELAVSSLPGVPKAVSTVKLSNSHVHDSYIVVSFVNSTLVLSVGETVEEVSDSGLLDSVSTMDVSLLRDETLVQVHEGGIRHIKQDRRANEWKTPGRKKINRVSVNTTQVVVALDSGEVVYFELESGGQLLEVDKKDMGADVASLALGEVPRERQRSSLLAVGTYNQSVRVLRLEPDAYLQVRFDPNKNFVILMLADSST